MLSEKKTKQRVKAYREVYPDNEIYLEITETKGYWE
jgi:hypothetical protein